MEETPDLEKIKLREEIREEMEDDQRQLEEHALDRDHRVRALLVSFTLLAGVLLPFVGLVLGVMVRAFRWAAGF